MPGTTIVNGTASSRDLVRALRSGVVQDEPDVMPESVAWHVFLELKRRGEPKADSLFIGALRSLHSRRTLVGTCLPNQDRDPDEHRLVQDPFLQDLWKAYKKCIRNNRTGPASQLLRDIEEALARSA
jgi:hypothetical protein